MHIAAFNLTQQPLNVALRSRLKGGRCGLLEPDIHGRLAILGWHDVETSFLIQALGGACEDLVKDALLMAVSAQR